MSRLGLFVGMILSLLVPGSYVGSIAAGAIAGALHHSNRRQEAGQPQDSNPADESSPSNNNSSEDSTPPPKPVPKPAPVPDHSHGLAKVDVAFATLSDLGLVDPEYADTRCYYNTLTEVRSHWLCDVGNRSYTIHVRPDVPQLSYVTSGDSPKANVQGTRSWFLFRGFTHTHSAASYKVTDQTLQDYGFPPATGWQCWAGGNVDAHWKCRLTYPDGTVHVVTVHITGVGRPNLVGNGWFPTANVSP